LAQQWGDVKEHRWELLLATVLVRLKGGGLGAGKGLGWEELWAKGTEGWKAPQMGMGWETLLVGELESLKVMQKEKKLVTWWGSPRASLWAQGTELAKGKELAL
jgi:hypothetical protein